MRIRSVKPEFWKDPHSTGRWPADVSLLYIALWNYADDWGKFEYDPDLVASELDPFRAKWPDIRSALKKLEATECLLVYEVQGRWYGKIPKLRKHQHPQHPSKDVLPEPPPGLTEPSLSPHIQLTRESSGEESSFPPGEGSPKPVNQGELPLRGGLSPPAPPAAPAEEVLLSFPCKATERSKASTFDVTPTLVSAWIQEFPGLDVLSVLTKAHQWEKANEPKLRTWPGTRMWLHDVWLKNPINSRSGKHERTESDTAEQDRMAAEEWRTARSTGAVRNPGRRLPTPGKGEEDPVRVQADGGDREAAGGSLLGDRGTPGSVQDGPGMEPSSPGGGPRRKGVG